MRASSSSQPRIVHLKWTRRFFADCHVLSKLDFHTLNNVRRFSEWFSRASRWLRSFMITGHGTLSKRSLRRLRVTAARTSRSCAKRRRTCPFVTPCTENDKSRLNDQGLAKEAEAIWIRCLGAQPSAPSGLTTFNTSCARARGHKRRRPNTRSGSSAKKTSRNSRRDSEASRWARCSSKGTEYPRSAWKCGSHTWRRRIPRQAETSLPISVPFHQQTHSTEK
mmetsp:Transcript_17410/g.56996  ORF Transcript_17410/g.56996 Transcript_17410/m.56996 type:complete len:222 (+) Transcript_17410:679-1344(+)